MVSVPLTSMHGIVLASYIPSVTNIVVGLVIVECLLSIQLQKPELFLKCKGKQRL